MKVAYQGALGQYHAYISDVSLAILELCTVALVGYIHMCAIYTLYI